MTDIYNLKRFIDAQDGGVYDCALSEIRGGRKESHWMWYIFPQIAGLGTTPTSRLYSIMSADEARAYLADPVLGPRLREISNALLQLPGSDAEEIFGRTDSMKLRSSMTLFDHVSPDDVFARVLDKFFAGRRDSRSLSIISRLL